MISRVVIVDLASVDLLNPDRVGSLVPFDPTAQSPAHKIVSGTKMSMLFVRP
ncbi:MAG TPA: hypothetical protein VK556_08420 [Candidatus Udaeobacter sp.]|nr:hypothetical protein [Candidatus Udaeobacter sp.]